MSAIEVDSGRVVHKWNYYSGYDVIFSPDGTRVAVVAEAFVQNDYVVEVLEYPELKLINTFHCSNRVDRFVGNRDFVAADWDDEVMDCKVFNIHTGKVTVILNNSNHMVYSADGKTFWLVARTDREGGYGFGNKDSYTDQTIWSQELSAAAQPLRIHVSKDDNTLLLVFSNGEVQCWTRRRPEAWWGIFYRYECWLALGTFAFLLISFYRDMKTWGKLRSA